MNIKTKELKEISDLLVDAWNKWIEYHGTKNDTSTESFRFGIHACQGVLAINELSKFKKEKEDD